MSKHIGSSFDLFLKEEKLFDEAEAVAIKRVFAYQLQAELKKRQLSKLTLAKQMRTSRSSLERLLDPSNTAVTLKTLVKLAHVLGKKVTLTLAA